MGEDELSCEGECEEGNVGLEEVADPDAEGEPEVAPLVGHGCEEASESEPEVGEGSVDAPDGLTGAERVGDVVEDEYEEDDSGPEPGVVDKVDDVASEGVVDDEVVKLRCGDDEGEGREDHDYRRRGGD